MKLHGKVVVVSGAASGLGWGTAQHCLREAGARVVTMNFGSRPRA